MQRTNFWEDRRAARDGKGDITDFEAERPTEYTLAEKGPREGPASRGNGVNISDVPFSPPKGFRHRLSYLTPRGRRDHSARPDQRGELCQDLFSDVDEVNSHFIAPRLDAFAPFHFDWAETAFLQQARGDIVDE